VINIIPAWQFGLIQRLGRLTLIKAVIAARTIHQLLIAEAPVWLLDEVVKMQRAFFWAGDMEVSTGKCLVSWETVCKPTEFGGLGVKNRKLQGLALRVRWEWLRRTDPSKPWAGLPMMRDTQAEELFYSLAVIKVGDGRRTFFWLDRWVDGLRVAEIAPILVAAVSTRKKQSRTVAEGLNNNRWMLDVQGEMSEEGYRPWVDLWLALARIQREETVQDVFTWTGAVSGKYTARDTYRMLCQGGIRSVVEKPIWRSYAPPKCKLFGWLATKYRLWTSDRRAQHGLQDDTVACFTCLQEEDTVDHILAQCVYAREVWMRCMHTVGLEIVEPESTISFQSWWLRARGLVHRLHRWEFETLVILVSWILWKQRNARVFGNTREQYSPIELVHRIKEDFELWKLARQGGRLNMPRE
jgi:hypothetical protein